MVATTCTHFLCCQLSPQGGYYIHMFPMLSLVPLRVATRATVIPFQEPTACPETSEEEDGFDTLEELMASHQISSAVGWAIQLRKKLLGKREHVRELKQQLRGSFQGRTATNWAILLFFAEEVRSHHFNVLEHYTLHHTQRISA